MSKHSSSLNVSDKVLASFIPAKVFNYHQEASITSLDFHDSGQYLISCGIDKSIQLYDMHKGVFQKDIQSQKYGAHLAKFTHQDLNCLYASTPEQEGGDHSIRYLALSSNTYLKYFKGHKEQVTQIEVNPCNDTFISASLDRTVKIWDLKSSAPIGNLDVGQPSVIAFDPQGIVFAVGKYPDPTSKKSTGSLLLYDTNNFDKAPFLTVSIPIIAGQTWTKLEFANNGKYIMISTDCHEHYVIDAFLGALLTTLVTDVSRSSKEYNGDWMSLKYPYSGSACFTPCGRYALIGSPRGKISFFDLTVLKLSEESSQNPKRLLPFKTKDTEGEVPKVIEFNPKLLIFATADNVVTVWRPNFETV